MLSRSALGRHTQRAVRRSWQQQNRGLAAPASGSFAYEAGDAQGIKFASRDIPGPVASLAIVAKAGTRYQAFPGLTEALQLYAFKNTERRSTLRIQRESELLGSALQTYHSRENLVVGAKFLRDDLPYFVELLAEVAQQTKYAPHVLHEEIYPIMKLNQQALLANTTAMAQNSAFGLAFHRGLGESINASSSLPISKYVDAESVADFAASAYAKPSFAIVGNGVAQGELNKWVGEFFTDIPSQPAYKLESQQSKYFGGEERISHGSGNSMVIAFPGSSSPTGSSYKPEASVLAALLGGPSSIKWSAGSSRLLQATEAAPGLKIQTKSDIFSDAGLLSITLSGSANDVAKNAKPVVDIIKAIASGISNEDLAKAKALAKFKELEYGQSTQAAMELTGAGLVQGGKAYQIDEVGKAVDSVTAEKVQQLAKEALENKASVSAVGDLYVLPYAEEIGLRV
ncbi:hypothetical protein WHR41_03630 [Cladosporium halotolerans]|uniref:Cytochrome b-c1 complex subunit 2, mitochondrial n=1 Tax=Cladosporium halotolerans TaxID=1052096 RepID=A0AB34KRB7_9PEZI